MSKYPMLIGLDEARVDRIGGKAAILEEIVKRWKDAPVPEFKVHPDGENFFLPYASSERRVLRASSVLDVFGGCGLHSTYHDVDYFNCSDVVYKIRQPAACAAERIVNFASSIGEKAEPVAIIDQKPGSPRFWAVLLQHPNNADVILINYSDGPSAECMSAGYTGGFPDRFMSIDRDTYAAVCFRDATLKGTMPEGCDPLVLLDAALNYLRIQDLGIVHPGWTSIMEAGIHQHSSEIYQFTPIRKRSNVRGDYSPGRLVFGASEKLRLPVVQVPEFTDANSYAVNYPDDKVHLPEFPDFEHFLSGILAAHGKENILRCGLEGIFWSYMASMDSRYPDGYIVITAAGRNYEFDISMSRAKAVLFHCSKEPLLYLNHGVSRALHKAQVVVLDRFKAQIRALRTGTMVAFSCDGTSYELS